MSTFLEEITRENIKLGDFLIKTPEGENKRAFGYLGIVDSIKCEIITLITNHGDRVDRSFTKGYLIKKFKKIKGENIKEINDHNGNYFYIKEPIFREEFFVPRKGNDVIRSYLGEEKRKNLVILGNHKVGDKIKELEDGGFDFYIHSIHKVRFTTHLDINTSRKKHLKSKIYKIILKKK